MVWLPTPVQTSFLACPDYEVLYGGAAGGGKTDALLIDAWCASTGAHMNRNHRAVIFRKQYVDLLQVIERGQEILPRIMPGTTYNQQRKEFTNKWGAKLQMAHCANDLEAFEWRGWAWNYVAFEELTLWATDKVYRYISSRCRTADRSLPCYIRATTNPDGPGQKWVMEHFAIQEDGGPSVQVFEKEFEEVEDDGSVREVMRKVRRRFIPAKLKDNPHLRGTGYRERLNDLPPEQREQLLEGKWTGNRIAGAYFVKEMQAARHQGRITLVPHQTGMPVNTFWDLGWNDTTAIWFHQFIALCNRFPLCYQNSGETLAHYAALLQQLSHDRGFVYGTHYLPHDADNVSLQTGTSAKKMLQELLPGHRFQVVPRVEQKLNSIQQLRAAFPSMWIDKDECTDGIAALDAYRKKWDRQQEIFKDEPIHDSYSNYADAMQQFGMGFRAAAGGTQLHAKDDERRSRRNPRSTNWKTA